MSDNKRNWRTKKDGTPLTMGENANRLQMIFNAKALGAVGLTVLGVASIANGAFYKYPVLADTMTYIFDHSQALTGQLRDTAQLGRDFATGTQIFAGAATLAGAAWAAVSAALDVEKCSQANRSVRHLGENYRPGDNKIIDARLRVEADAREAAQLQGITTP